MKLSIVIPSHLRADLLRRCLATVAAEFPFVTLIRLPAQSGFCVAANTGIRAATGDVVDLLNDDTEERVFWRNVRGRQLVRQLPRHVAVLVGWARGGSCRGPSAACGRGAAGEWGRQEGRFVVLEPGTQ